MRFTTVGYSTEDAEVFEAETVDLSTTPLHERVGIIEGFNKGDGVIAACTEAIKALLTEFKKEGLEQSSKEDYAEWWSHAVDNFTKLVENGNGILFHWAVECDSNYMYIEGATLAELVDFFAKECEKAMRDAEK